MKQQRPFHGGWRFFFPLHRPAVWTLTSICVVHWVNTSSTFPQQQSCAARPCVVPTAAACAETQTVMFTCTWTPWPTVSSGRMADPPWPVSSARQTWRCSSGTFSASATAASRAATRPTPCTRKGTRPKPRPRPLTVFSYWSFFCSLVKPTHWSLFSSWQVGVLKYCFIWMIQSEKTLWKIQRLCLIITFKPFVKMFVYIFSWFFLSF